MANVGARQVGEFMQPRRMVRTYKNPMDKATIVSIFPKDIKDEKVSIQPSKFFIPAGTVKDPSITVIGPSSWWHDRGEEQPLLEIPSSAVQMAESLIVDYCEGFLGCNVGSAMPGLFYIPGEFTKAQVLKDYSLKIAQAHIQQREWFAVLEKIADSLWARANGNPLVIWDEMRLAARELGHDSKPWLKDYNHIEMVRCFACGSMRNPEFPICPTCKNVDATHPRAGEIKVAAI
jgi:hypothetical protein